MRIGRPDLLLQVDGGVARDTAPLCVAAGANVLVAGSAVFGAADRRRRSRSTRGCDPPGGPAAEKSRRSHEPPPAAAQALPCAGKVYRMKQDNKKRPARHPEFAANCDMLFGLFPLAFMAVYLYGLRPALMLAVSLLTAVICDFLVAQMRGQAYDSSENSSLVFAAAFTLMLPATAGLYIVVAGSPWRC